MIIEWDDHKDKINLRKHNVAFAEVITVFNDRKMLSIFDEAHSANEERWITIGMSSSGKIYVVVHTHEESKGEEIIRIISARRAVNYEAKMYYNINGGKK